MSGFVTALGIAPMLLDSRLRGNDGGGRFPPFVIPIIRHSNHPSFPRRRESSSGVVNEKNASQRSTIGFQRLSSAFTFRAGLNEAESNLIAAILDHIAPMAPDSCGFLQSRYQQV